LNPEFRMNRGETNEVKGGGVYDLSVKIYREEIR
jgi:hypothetical protein